MSFTYLVTRPEYDDTTHYLSDWSKETIKLAENQGLKVLDLQREKANKNEFEGKMEKFSPVLVMINGHGDIDSVTGHKNQILVKVGLNEGILKSKIVYALSCKSAKILGPRSVQAGALNYTGYKDDFIFVYEPELISRPLSDKTAGLFLKPSNILIESLIKGNSVRESFEKSKNALKKNFNLAISTSESDSTTARFLWWNLRNFSSYGDLDTSIRQLPN